MSVHINILLNYISRVSNFNIDLPWEGLDIGETALSITQQK